jgi:collagenase-like PrtC family protease
MKISYTNVEELIGSVWKFNNSGGCEVELLSVGKAVSKSSGKILVFRHLTYDKPNFATNEAEFRRSFNWADRIK